MNQPDTEICGDCGQIKLDNIIFHELFCYDVYVVSPPCPQNARQRGIDEYMMENIVKPLEQQGYKCYHGSRNIIGGELILQAMSYPITIIPITIVPVFKDNSFSTFRNLLLRPDYLERIVFLSFDSTTLYPPVVSKISYSISVKDECLLQKLMETIKKKRTQIPLQKRKRKCEMGIDPESTVSSIEPEFHRLNPFRRSDRSRISFLIRPTNKSRISEEATSSVSEFIKTDSTEVNMEDFKKLSPSDLLRYCHFLDEKIRNSAINNLSKIIEKNITTFYKKNNLQIFEKEIRFLLEKEYAKSFEMNTNFEKLYFWIIAAIYVTIYKCDDLNLKAYVKSLTLKKYKASQTPFDQICQKTYRKLSLSLLSKIKTWPKKFDSNVLYIKKMEYCIGLIDHQASDIKETTYVKDTLYKHLLKLPWDIKYLFVVIITEKILKNVHSDSKLNFFNEICASVGKKHRETFLDVIEQATEHIQDSYTEGTIHGYLQLMKIIMDLHIVRRNKNKKLKTIFKHYFQKLVYHPLKDVREFVTPFLFSNDLNSIDICHLGSVCVRINEDVAETCICEKLASDFPDMILTEKLQTTSNALIFKAKIQNCDVLLYTFKQKTLNDVLQTNSSDDAYETFQEMSTALKKCQGNDYIVERLSVPSNCILPFYVVQQGKPLLHFLHEKENQLTWSQMIGILIDITKAVQHCHNNCVILRDITPACFMVFPTADGSFKTKLANFLYAKCLSCKDDASSTQDYVNEMDSLCFQGDDKEPVAAYFSAPETLKNKTFSKCTDIWMLNVTFYSILLYGRQPYQELSHLNVSQFVKEIISGHKPEIPNSFSKDLCKILEANLNHEPNERMLSQQLLHELETCKNNFGLRMNTVYTVKSVCFCINPEDIHRGYVNIKDDFVQEKIEEPSHRVYSDYTKWNNNRLSETVSVRMGLNIKRKLKAIDHENILQVETIESDSYTTTLVYYPFENDIQTLNRIHATSKSQLLSYLDQLTLALQNLHSQNILHCNLRGNHVYVNPNQNTIKLGHFGRAVTLEGKQTHPYVIKMMPHEAEKWSAPEVKAKGMYSKASDIFSLAVVFWEVISTQISPEYYNLKLFVKCSDHEDMQRGIVSIFHSLGDTFKKLVKCIQECWNPNPTKRPSLENIRDTIEQTRDDTVYVTRYRYGDSCSTSEDSIYESTYTYCDEEEMLVEDEEPPYETIIDCTAFDFSLNYAWKYVIYEFVSTQGSAENTTKLIDYKETSEYEDVGIQWSKKRNNPGIIL